MIKFLQKLELVWAKDANFFRKKIGENIFKIITCVPRHTATGEPDQAANATRNSNSTSGTDSSNNATVKPNETQAANKYKSAVR
jgi:hypothetical protein